MDKTQRKIRWIAGAGVGLAMLLGTAAIITAQTDAPRQGRFGPRMGGRGFAGGPAGLPGFLFRDLSETQRQQARDIIERYEPQMEPLRDRQQEARLALNAAVTASPVDEGSIRQTSAELAAAETEVTVLRAYMSAEITTLLTPEQLSDLQERRDRMRERRENGPPARRP